MYYGFCCKVLAKLLNRSTVPDKPSGVEKGQNDLALCIIFSCLSVDTFPSWTSKTDGYWFNI